MALREAKSCTTSKAHAYVGYKQACMCSGASTARPAGELPQRMPPGRHTRNVTCHAMPAIRCSAHSNSALCTAGSRLHACMTYVSRRSGRSQPLLRSAAPHGSGHAPTWACMARHGMAWRRPAWRRCSPRCPWQQLHTSPWSACMHVRMPPSPCPACAAAQPSQSITLHSTPPLSGWQAGMRAWGHGGLAQPSGHA